eukprot:g1390.t1
MGQKTIRYAVLDPRKSDTEWGLPRFIPPPFESSNQKFTGKIELSSTSLTAGYFDSYGFLHADIPVKVKAATRFNYFVNVKATVVGSNSTDIDIVGHSKTRMYRGIGAGVVKVKFKYLSSSEDRPQKIKCRLIASVLDSSETTHGSVETKIVVIDEGEITNLPNYIDSYVSFAAPVLLLKNNLQIRSKGKLTISGPTLILIAPDVDITIEDGGILEVLGTSKATVTFLSTSGHWGGVRANGHGSAIYIKYCYFLKSGAGTNFNGAVTVGHRTEKAAIDVRNDAQVELVHSTILHSVGQAVVALKGNVVMDNCVVRWTVGGMQFSESTVQFKNGLLADVRPYLNENVAQQVAIDGEQLSVDNSSRVSYSNDGKDDCDGIYAGSQVDLEIFNVVIAGVNDDGIDFGTGNGGRLIVQDSWIETCNHEGIALSNNGSSKKNVQIVNSVVTGCQQGIELGFSTISMEVNVLDCLIFSNSVGIRLGDNYQWKVDGIMKINHSVLTKNLLYNVLNLHRSLCGPLYSNELQEISNEATLPEFRENVKQAGQGRMIFNGCVVDRKNGFITENSSNIVVPEIQFDDQYRVILPLGQDARIFGKRFLLRNGKSKNKISTLVKRREGEVHVMIVWSATPPSTLKRISHFIRNYSFFHRLNLIAEIDVISPHVAHNQTQNCSNNEESQCGKESCFLTESWFLDFYPEKYHYSIYVRGELVSMVEHKGCGSFRIFLLYDEDPWGIAVKGKGVVSANIYTLKQELREWLAGRFRIHSSQTAEEANHDLKHLFGITPNAQEMPPLSLLRPLYVRNASSSQEFLETFRKRHFFFQKEKNSMDTPRKLPYSTQLMTILMESSAEEMIATMMRSEIDKINVDVTEIGNQIKKISMEPDIENDMENVMRAVFLAQMRFPLLTHIPLDVKWWHARINVNHIGKNFYILRERGWSPFVQCRSIAHVARALLVWMGEISRDETIVEKIDKRLVETFGKIRNILKALRKGANIPRTIIALSSNRGAPFTLIDGNHRAVAFVAHAITSEKSDFSPIHAQIGFSNELSERKPWRGSFFCSKNCVSTEETLAKCIYK